MVVQSDEGATEGEGFAVGSEYRGIDDSGRGYEEGCNDEDDSEADQHYGKNNLIDVILLHNRM